MFTSKGFIIATKLAAVLVVLWALAATLTALLICRPLAYYWDQTLDGSCSDMVLTYQIAGSLNIATDVIVLLLPLPYLFRLELALQTKLALVATFAIGFL